VKIQDFQLFDNHIAIYERESGLPKVTVYRLPPLGEPIGQLQGGRAIDFTDPTYSVDPEESEFHSSVLRFHYSSMRTPPSVFDYDMDSGVSVLKKINTVSYWFHYLCFSFWSVISMNVFFITSQTPWWCDL
jgi:oligopeptidase B